MPDSLPDRLAFLNVPGEMAALMREKDWSRTPFGPIDGWSPALRSAVSICLGSRFPMVLYWGETRALIYNDAWAPVPGQKHPWALGRPGPEVWSEIWDIIGPMFDHVMAHGEATWSEDQLLPLNRYGYVEECYFYYSYSPVRGDDGRVEGIFTAVTETTYRVLAERRERLLRRVAEDTSAARTAEEACASAALRLGEVPEEAPFFLVYLRDEATGALRLAGRSGLEAGDALAPATLEMDGLWPLAAATTEALMVEGLPGGRNLPGAPWPEPIVQALLAPIPSARPDSPHGFIVAGLSPRRRLDGDYRTLFERVAGHIAGAIANVAVLEEERRRAEQLAELDRAKTAFFSNASHEFRTPLTLMLGPVEDLLERAGSGPSVTVDRDALELVQRNGQRLLRLVNTLLDFSRIEAGRVRAQFQPTDLAAYTAELASSFRSAMDRAGLAFAIDCPALAEPVWIDREMWEKIVLNLISNAFKYTLQGGVTVSLHASAEGALLSVADTGVGIPQAELDRVFDRFHRIEGQEGRTHEGTGIGLALVKDLTALHGGRVGVTSTEGQGTVFSVLLPFGTAHVPQAEAAQPLPPASTATRAETFVAEALRWLPEVDAPPPDAHAEPPALAAPLRGRRVLLADDNADMRGYVQRLLADAGYLVTAVADGQEALERARLDPPDLVLSDVMMPRLDGFGLLQALRGEAATKELPIILLSARAGEEAAIEGIEAGADDYLVKPFSARELLARVEGALRLAGQRRDTSTALRLANEQLEERVAAVSRERDRSWRLSRDMIGIADADGVWLSVNPAWERVLGWTAADIVGRTSEWMEHPEDVARTRAEIAHLDRGRTTYDFENRFRTRDGRYRSLTWTAVPEGGLLYCIARDVTQERERAAELEQAREALRQSQKMEAIGQLTGGIAHDFNNMLTGVIGSLDLLQRRLGPQQQQDEKVARYVAAASTSAQRAAALTQRLLAFGRRQSLDLRPVDINRLVAGLEELLHRTLGENVQLRTRLAADAWMGCSDANQLENALLNLCINARDAMPDGGTLTVATANRHVPMGSNGALDPGDYVELSVADTGTGMAPEVLEKVFEPFFTTKPIGKGTGLGLSMIYGFLKQSQGYVEIDSAPGRGTAVRLSIPRAHAADAADSVAGGTAELRRGGGETVLVVEDEADVRMLVTDVLEELGYAAVEATDAQAALRLLRDLPRIDLMVSDVGLPGMNGRVLADEARRLRPGLKVLLVTGYAQDAADRSGFLGPGMEMMIKPFAIDALASAIRGMLEG